MSILSFVPSMDDDGKYLTCRAENPNIADSGVEDRWRLDVQYQPVVSLRMGSTLNPDDIKEGDDVYFECIVKANPKAYKLSWFKDVSIGKIAKNKIILRSSSSRLTLLSLFFLLSLLPQYIKTGFFFLKLRKIDVL